MRNLRGPHCIIAGEVVVKLHYSPAYKEESDSMDAQTSLSLTKAPFPHTGIVQRIDGRYPPLLIRETSLRIPWAFLVVVADTAKPWTRREDFKHV